MSTTWIIATQPLISALIEIGRSRHDTVTVVAAGTDPQALRGVDSVVSVDAADTTPAEALAPVVAAAVTAQPGDLVLAGTSPSERVLAGAVAARLRAPILRGVREVTSDQARVDRFGGIAEQSVSLADVAVLVLDGGAETTGEAAEIMTVPAEDTAASVTVTQPAEDRQVNLAAAKRIVACGRGFASEDDLQVARDLASALDAELACSRPLAEGADWFPRDRYIGVSGQHVAPEIYVALGISGQLQHVAGMRSSKTVVAVNTDAEAPIFAVSDYGIVGDVSTVVPALTEALR